MEDQCTGEARFSSQALLDEKALAACLAYVDLNPIREKIVKTQKTSAYTSIKKRIEIAQQDHTKTIKQSTTHFPFVGNPR